MQDEGEDDQQREHADDEDSDSSQFAAHIAEVHWVERLGLRRRSRPWGGSRLNGGRCRASRSYWRAYWRDTGAGSKRRSNRAAAPFSSVTMLPGLSQLIALSSTVFCWELYIGQI